MKDSVVDLLARTKPWLRVVGVFMWIGVVFMALAALGILAAGSMGAMQKANPQFSGALMVGLSVLYGVLAVLYVVPARRIWTCGSAIDRLVHSRNLVDLHAALEAQRSFWKFVGLGFLLCAAAYALFIIGAIGMGMMAGASGS